MNKSVWEKLYELGTEYVQQAPWVYTGGDRLFEVRLADGTEGWCSILGQGGELLGLIFYAGKEGMDSCLRLLNAAKLGRSGMSEASQQESLCLFLGDSGDVGKEQKAVIRELGRRYRGRGKWLYFESYRPHCAPVCPTDEEAAAMAEMLGQLLPALAVYRNEKHTDTDRPVIYTFDGNAGLLTARPMPDDYPLNEVGEVREKNLFMLMSAARNKPKNGQTLEAGCYYTEDLVKDDNGQICKIRLALIADHDSGMVISSRVLGAEDSSGQILTDMLSDWVVENGLPKKIYVPDELYQKRLQSLSARIKVPVQTGRMDASSHFMYSYQNRGMEPGGPSGFAGPFGAGLPEEILNNPEKMKDFLTDFMRMIGMKNADIKKVLENPDQKGFDLLNKALGEAAQGLPDEFWHEDWDEDDWDEDDLDEDDWDDEPMWMTLHNRREKEDAVTDFFQSIDEAQDYGMDTVVCFGDSGRPWQALLMEGNRPLLLQQASAAGVKVPGNARKADIAEAIRAAFEGVKKKDRKQYLTEIMGAGITEFLLYMNRVIKKQNREGEDIWIAADNFHFEGDVIVKALEWGIVDVFYGEDMDTVYLKLVPAAELFF